MMIQHGTWWWCRETRSPSQQGTWWWCREAWSPSQQGTLWWCREARSPSQHGTWWSWLLNHSTAWLETYPDGKPDSHAMPCQQNIGHIPAFTVKLQCTRMWHVQTHQILPPQTDQILPPVRHYERRPVVHAPGSVLHTLSCTPRSL